MSADLQKLVRDFFVANDYACSLETCRFPAADLRAACDRARAAEEVLRRATDCMFPALPEPVAFDEEIAEVYVRKEIVGNTLAECVDNAFHVLRSEQAAILGREIRKPDRRADVRRLRDRAQDVVDRQNLNRLPPVVVVALSAHDLECERNGWPTQCEDDCEFVTSRGVERCTCPRGNL